MCYVNAALPEVVRTLYGSSFAANAAAGSS
jgi:hypothetical protein